MTDFQQQYALWDEFLTVWPASRLASMTLDEYTLAGAKDTFTYWIESRLDQLGSVWGGSAFKFGVYSRADTDEKDGGAGRSYSATHAWYSSLGNTADEAFQRVRGIVVQLVELAEKGDLEGIESLCGLGPAIKWKIAFHYQNRGAPRIVDIFKRETLAASVGEPATKSMAALHEAAVAKRPPELGILEFGRQTWEAWSRTNLAIWKLSHGTDSFSKEERERYLQDHLAVLHEDTPRGQAESFRDAKVGS